MTLIEQRHPDLGRLVAIWRAERHGNALPPASALGPQRLAELSALTVLITSRDNGGGHLTIVIPMTVTVRPTTLVTTLLVTVLAVSFVRFVPDPERGGGFVATSKPC